MNHHLKSVSNVNSPRVLSVQSHVVSGYCGNKCVTFPLQLLGFEVDFINSVQLSNHTQYRSARGQIFTSKDLDEISLGLEENDLYTLYDHIISGYVADVSYIQSLGIMITNIKKVRQEMGLDCLYTFDPVLGDDGIGFYVPDAENIVSAYKEYLLPLADVITPNRFEASYLTSVEIDPASPHAFDQALEAIRVLHQIGVGIVALTSLDIEPESNNLICIVSKAIPLKKNNVNSSPDGYQPEVWIIRIPKMDCIFTGTGDLFASLFTAWLRKTNFNLSKSLERTVNTINLILEDTFEHYKASGCDGTWLSKELRIVQSQKHILSPDDRFKAKPFKLSQT